MLPGVRWMSSVTCWPARTAKVPENFAMLDRLLPMALLKATVPLARIVEPRLRLKSSLRCTAECAYQIAPVNVNVPLTGAVQTSVACPSPAPLLGSWAWISTSPASQSLGLAALPVALKKIGRHGGELPILIPGAYTPV